MAGWEGAGGRRVGRWRMKGGGVDVASVVDAVIINDNKTRTNRLIAAKSKNKQRRRRRRLLPHQEEEEEEEEEEVEEGEDDDDDDGDRRVFCSFDHEPSNRAWLRALHPREKKNILRGT